MMNMQAVTERTLNSSGYCNLSDSNLFQH